MSNQDEQASQFTPEEPPIISLALPINTTLVPVRLSEILQKLGISGPRIAAEALVDHEFTITGCKAFPSAFKEHEHAYFVVAKDARTGEIFTTVLGGMAVTEILDALVAVSFNSPLTVTLRWNEGGRFQGYYTLE
jgi:hypothetical protein